ncbi:hypothetical protein LYSHEL_27060 [Lysobacter helvus]|uniref:DUF5625 domain-containing protein n=2 Tax=Lysobacteraceae TaxID=32033 RepID=A0ABN6FVF8_9GAMM|nr:MULTISPECIES: hypothetical protein [Lysobacter]BCT93679.1 hypothetical protein LYSCAS_27030 [Lysobacter caseinilyticus]BCT96835.1 hypothetical protein LYSHEL_27060 [Lysobacter helvus]
MKSAVMLVALLPLFGCARHEADSNAIAAFALHPAGSIEGLADVPEQGLYAISLRYEFATPEARQAAWEVASSLRGGASFDVAVTLKTPVGGTAVDATFKCPRLTSWSEHELEAELTRLELTPGRYEVVARIRNGPSPMGVPIKIAIAPAYVGK